jgi:DNA polymerase III epsilon subunit-like protein
VAANPSLSATKSQQRKILQNQPVQKLPIGDSVAQRAAMRRRYPGHKSYGLGRLCELYNIDLETHHRALCDARATSHLLNLINAKREQSEPD